MANKFHKGNFEPKNPTKYVGTWPITYRSSWELALMRKFDEHPYVISWASESISIPYLNPVTGKQSVYIPDFLVMFRDKNGNTRKEMIEVKPAKENPFEAKKPGRVNSKLQLIQAVNAAKWQAAARFCMKRGIFFRVMTEHELFTGYSRK